MPYMMPSDLHVNRELSTVAVAYQQSSDEFIADKVFPAIGSDSPTDFYNKMGRKAFLQTEMIKRAPRTETPGVDWNFTRDSFATEVWGLHHDVEDQFRSSADANWNLDRSGTELITAQAMLRRELEWFSTFFKSGVWGYDNLGVTSATPGVNQFQKFDQAGSSPIRQFRQARRRFHRRTGLKPNTLVMGPNVWDCLIDHPEFIERIKYTQSTIALSRALVGTALEIPNIMVAEAVMASDNQPELVADPVPATQYIAGDSFLLTYSNPRPSKESPSAGYTFNWTGYLGASAFGGRVKKFRMEPIACDRIEIEMAYDYKIVAPELGEFNSGAVN